MTPLWKGFTYFPHQLEGIAWMLHKERQGVMVPTRDYRQAVHIRGGFQCDDMGLGKTIQMAAVMYHHVLPNTLLIAPLAMVHTWTEVCQRMGLPVYLIEKGAWVRQTSQVVATRFLKRGAAVYISNYDKMQHQMELFKGPTRADQGPTRADQGPKGTWDRIVLDEAHRIRNGDGIISLLARRLVAPVRWAITGTPLVNSDKDIVSLMAFLGVPHSYLWKWEARYLRILPDLMIHRTLDSIRGVIQGAPPRPHVTHLVLPFVTKEEEEFYVGVQGFTEALLEKYAGDTRRNAEIFILLLRLRQISVCPQVYINAKRREDTTYRRADWVLPCTKFEAIKDIIKADEGQHHYLIFCQFHDEMGYLHDFLTNGWMEEVFLYHGGLSAQQRTDVLAASKKAAAGGKKSAMLLQLQAGGVGLNLQEYDRIIFLSPWWTAALMDQAVARAVRMGQTQTVQVYHLELNAESEKSINIDRLMHSKADEKRDRLDYIFAAAGSIPHSSHP